MVDRLWVALVLVFLLPVVLVLNSKSGSGYAGGETAPLLVGRQALDSLTDASRNRMLLVNLWATWCTPCIGELPHLAEVRDSLFPAAEVVAVSIGDPNIESVERFHDRAGLALPMVWLDPDEAQALRDHWQIPDVLPVTLAFGPDGGELSRVAGARSREFFFTMAAGDAPDSAGGGEGPDREEEVLHVNVVGDPDSTGTRQLLQEARRLAGAEGVDLFDPSDPRDSAAIDSLLLPRMDVPYAQPCVGLACGRPCTSPEMLAEVSASLLGQ